MKIVLVVQEFPYPPIHGGRVDSWNRILALKSLGVEIFLICWDEIVKGDIPSFEEIQVVRETVDFLSIFNVTRDIKRLLSLFYDPSLVAGRYVSSLEYTRLLAEVKSFSPSLVFIDGIYGGKLGVKLANDFSLKLGLRLHNIEHVYMKGQLKLANKFRHKASLFAALIHLKRFENNLIKRVDAFFDISIDDLKYWEKQGYSHGVWLPPVCPPLSERIENGSNNIKYDICFLGNLHTPNNVEGVRWFIKYVIPLLLEENPELRILIMGSNPNQEVISLCKLYANITLLTNPNEPRNYFSESKVLINPVQFGSGVNIKTIEMLFHKKDVVSTSIGVKGIPQEIRDIFCIADTPEEFKTAIMACIYNKVNKDNKQREQFLKYFEYSSVSKILEVLLA